MRRFVVAGVLAGVLAIGVAATAGSAPVPSAAPGDALLPDLRTQPPHQLFVRGGNLRLSNTISNTGAGPAEIYPEQTSGGDCDGDGIANNDRIAFQRVFDDSADPRSPGYFIRGQDTAATVRRVGCMVYHPAHSHWHFEDFSLYLLKREPDAVTVAASEKVSFCVIDTDHLFPARPGSPSSSHYGNAGCGPASVEGLSIGWADTYDASLPGQSLAVAGLPAGNYCLISRADPVDRIDELSDTNNNRRTRLHLDPAAGVVQTLAGPCQFAA